MKAIMQKLIQYLKEVRAEMMKVSWPPWNELTGGTILVIILSLIMSLFVFACDKVIYFLVGLFIKSS